VLWLASGAFSGHDQDALDNEFSKLQLVGVTTDRPDTTSGETSKVTSVMCFRVGGKAVQSAGTRLGLGNGTQVGIATFVGLAFSWILV
jgi:hypothetical protein